MSASSPRIPPSRFQRRGSSDARPRHFHATISVKDKVRNQSLAWIDSGRATRSQSWRAPDNGAHAVESMDARGAPRAQSAKTGHVGACPKQEAHPSLVRPAAIERCRLVLRPFALSSHWQSELQKMPLSTPSTDDVSKEIDAVSLHEEKRVGKNLAAAAAAAATEELIVSLHRELIEKNVPEPLLQLMAQYAVPVCDLELLRALLTLCNPRITRADYTQRLIQYEKDRVRATETNINQAVATDYELEAPRCPHVARPDTQCEEEDDARGGCYHGVSQSYESDVCMQRRQERRALVVWNWLSVLCRRRVGDGGISHLTDVTPCLGKQEEAELHAQESSDDSEADAMAARRERGVAFASPGSDGTQTESVRLTKHLMRYELQDRLRPLTYDWCAKLLQIYAKLPDATPIMGEPNVDSSYLNMPLAHMLFEYTYVYSLQLFDASVWTHILFEMVRERSLRDMDQVPSTSSFITAGAHALRDDGHGLLKLMRAGLSFEWLTKPSISPVYMPVLGAAIVSTCDLPRALGQLEALKVTGYVWSALERRRATGQFGPAFAARAIKLFGEHVRVRDIPRNTFTRFL